MASYILFPYQKKPNDVGFFQTYILFINAATTVFYPDRDQQLLLPCDLPRSPRQSGLLPVVHLLLRRYLPGWSDNCVYQHQSPYRMNLYLLQSLRRFYPQHLESRLQSVQDLLSNSFVLIHHQIGRASCSLASMASCLKNVLKRIHGPSIRMFSQWI
ncbi:MAG: hypothetical protein K0Q56_2215, partial [Sporolactobacillus laevolacticus]|nr:hypothetical protein [Sporolactobacillus laevolacticus]